MQSPLTQSFKEFNRSFCLNENIPNGEINEQSFSKPYPRDIFVFMCNSYGKSQLE